MNQPALARSIVFDFFDSYCRKVEVEGEEEEHVQLHTAVDSVHIDVAVAKRLLIADMAASKLEVGTEVGGGGELQEELAVHMDCEEPLNGG